MPLIFLSSASSLTREERFYPLNFPPGHLHTLRTKRKDGRGRNLLVFFLSLSLFLSFLSPIFFTFLLFISSFSLFTFSFPSTRHDTITGSVWSLSVWNYPSDFSVLFTKKDPLRFFHGFISVGYTNRWPQTNLSLNHLLNMVIQSLGLNVY